MPLDFEARYRAARAAFLDHVDRAGLSADAKRFLWYHTIDLGGGLITPGLFDYRDQWARFGLPERFDGQTVLDAGPANGFFSFGFAQRGARTSCFDLPSLRALDRFPGQSVEQSLVKIERMMESVSPGGRHTEEELYWLLIDGPFRFCQQRLGLDVERHYLSIYDVSRETLNAPGGFDWVYAGDILLHLLYPLKALAALASVCRGTLVVVEQCPGAPTDPPAMIYRGGSDPAEDEVNWWLMNRACLEQLLRKLGFHEVREIGRHTAVLQSTGFEVERTVLHAIR
jgi:tRNA (mo5U34)-methyltransferase